MHAHPSATADSFISPCKVSSRSHAVFVVIVECAVTELFPSVDGDPSRGERRQTIRVGKLVRTPAPHAT